MLETIPFTAFMLPNGRREPFTYELATPEVLEKAELIIAAGFEFQIEKLRNGMVSATITDDNSDWAFAIHEDAPGLEVAINKMIMDFDIEKATADSKRLSDA